MAKQSCVCDRIGRRIYEGGGVECGDDDSRGARECINADGEGGALGGRGKEMADVMSPM